MKDDYDIENPSVSIRFPKKIIEIAEGIAANEKYDISVSEVLRWQIIKDVELLEMATKLKQGLTVECPYCFKKFELSPHDDEEIEETEQ